MSSALERLDGVSIGVDVGGTKIAAGLVDASGRVLTQRRLPTRPNDLLDDMESMCVALASEARAASLALVGIGVGIKGAVDREKGRLIQSLYLDKNDLPVVDRLGGAIDVPVWLENDVHAATIGELIFGVGRHVGDFLLLNAGTGISVGIVSNGRLYRGSSGVAGENGHVSMDQGGQFPCPCGLSGCMETIILRGRSGATAPDVAERIADDPGPSPAFDYLATSLADLLVMFSPGAVALAGGMTDLPATIAWLDRTARRLAPQASARLTQVAGAHGGANAGLVGSGALPFHALQPNGPR